jgi:hypothetical protein
VKKIIIVIVAIVVIGGGVGAYFLLNGKDDGADKTDNSDGSSQSASDNSVDAENADALTIANWQRVIKDVYGFDLNVPSGWTFKEGKKQTINPSYSVQFTLNDGDFETSYKAFAQHVFDLTAALSAGGNFKSTGSPDYNVAEQLSEIPNAYGIIMPIWCFEAPKYTIQVDISEDEAKKIAQIYLVAVK